jgi:hypothetical protein
MARTRRVKAVSFDPELLDLVERAAAAEGVGFSEWMRRAATARLGHGTPAAAPTVKKGAAIGRGPAPTKAPPPSRPAGYCPHPLSRRRAGVCGACGNRVR